MTDTHTTSHIPDEAVQAAYSASYGKIGFAIGKNPSEVMRAALTAALPHLAPCAVEASDVAIRQRIAGYADQYDVPDENGAWPDIQDAMVTVGDLRALRRILSNVVTKPVDVAAVRKQAFEEAARIADFGMMVPPDGGSPTKEEVDVALRIAAAIRALSAEPAQGEQCQPTHRHVKRGAEYQLIGTGKMQAEKWYEYPCERPVNSIDMQEVAIYRGDDGQLWVRPVAEFNDGRFEVLPATPTSEVGR